MGDIQVTRRTDDQLFLMLDEAALWIIKGSSGDVLKMGASLRAAIMKSQAIIDAGRHVSALLRRPDGMVIMFHAQMDRVRCLMGCNPG